MTTTADAHTLFPILGPTRIPVVLKIDLQDQVDYQADISDPALFATVSATTQANTPRNFFVVTLIADIVAVNDIPAKGTYVGRTRPIISSPNPAGGGAIADVTRTAMREHIFEILRTDGTEVGTIISTGFSGGEAPPGTGAPSGEKANWVIVGGTGAYIGARGQVGGTGHSGRAASMAEDPGKRRDNHGNDESIHPACCSLGPAPNCQHARRPGHLSQRLGSGNHGETSDCGRGTFSLCYRPRTDVPRCRPHAAVSVEPTFDRECTGHRNGWWNSRRRC